MAVELGQVYKCDKCGIIIEVVHAGPGKVVCCGAPATLLAENSTDAAQEKHVPVVAADEGGGASVSVGSVTHPMTEEHYIEFIEVMTPEGRCARQYLQAGQEPVVGFCLPAAGLKARAYCNLHGLWKGEG